MAVERRSHTAGKDASKYIQSTECGQDIFSTSKNENSNPRWDDRQEIASTVGSCNRRKMDCTLKRERAPRLLKDNNGIPAKCRGKKKKGRWHSKARQPGWTRGMMSHAAWLWRRGKQKPRLKPKEGGPSEERLRVLAPEQAPSTTLSSNCKKAGVFFCAGCCLWLVWRRVSVGKNPAMLLCMTQREVGKPPFWRMV